MKTEKPPRDSAAVTVARPFPTRIPNLDLMYLASKRRVTSGSPVTVPGRGTAPSRQRTQSATISRTRGKCSRSNSETESDSSRTRSQAQEIEFIFDNDFGKFDDTYSLSDDEIKTPDSILDEDRSQRVYRRSCRSLNVAPSTVCSNALKEREVILRNRALGPSDIKAFSLALMVNNKLEVLDFTGNEFGAEGAYHIAQVITENLFITDLSMAECSLGSGGIELLADAMKNNDTINRLDISGNGLQENDAYYVADILRRNDGLKELHVGHNFFREKGGELLGPAIADNTSLEILDLCWNHLRNKGAVAICHGIQDNIGLRELDLSWNGFHLQGSRALAKIFLHNFTLRFLDLTCNRLDKGCIDELLKGLARSEALRVLKLGNNPISCDGAKAILKCLTQHPSVALENLDITGQTVDRDFLNQLENLRLRRPITILHGPIMRIDELLPGSGTDVMANEESVTVLMEFLRLRNLKLGDLFPGCDQPTDDCYISQEDFKQGLLRVSIPIGRPALVNLASSLAQDDDGPIAIQDLLTQQHEHKKTLSSLMEQDVLFEDTQLGQLSAKLQALIALRSAATDRRRRSANRQRRDSVLSDDEHKPIRKQVVTQPTKQVVERRVENKLIEVRVDTVNSSRPRGARPVVSGVLTRTGQSGFSQKPPSRGNKPNNAPTTAGTPGPADDSVFV